MVSEICDVFTLQSKHRAFIHLVYRNTKLNMNEAHIIFLKELSYSTYPSISQKLNLAFLLVRKKSEKWNKNLKKINTRT